jgi:hypothetical protein
MFKPLEKRSTFSENPLDPPPPQNIKNVSYDLGYFIKLQENLH